MIDSTYRRALITETSSGISNATTLALAKASISLALVGRLEAISIEKRDNSIRSVIAGPRAINPPIWDTNTVQTNVDRCFQ